MPTFAILAQPAASAGRLPLRDERDQTPSQIDAAMPPSMRPFPVWNTGDQYIIEQRALAGFARAANHVPGPVDMSLMGQAVADAATNARNAINRSDLPPALAARVQDTLVHLGNRLADGYPMPAIEGDFRNHLYHLAVYPASYASFRDALEQLHNAALSLDPAAPSQTAAHEKISPAQKTDKKADTDRIFAGGVNGALEFYYKGMDAGAVPDPSRLPLASAYIALNGNADGNGYKNFHRALSEIGVNYRNAAQSAVYLVQPGMSQQAVINDIKNRLGTGFSRQLAQNPSMQAYLAERVGQAKSGQLLNITDLWQAAVGDSVKRAYNHDGGVYFRDVVDRNGSVPIISKLLGGFNFKSIASADSLAPQAYQDYARRSLGVDATVTIGSLFLPAKGLSPVLRGELSMVEGRIGFAGLADRLAQIRGTADAMAEAARGVKGGTVNVLDDVAPHIHLGQQEKHIPGNNNFIPGRSTINGNVNPQELLDGAHSGQYPIVGAGKRGDPIVDFGRPIGVDASSGLPTQYGTIHSGRNGAHIVPTNPTTIGGAR